MARKAEAAFVSCNRATRTAVQNELAQRGLGVRNKFCETPWQQDESLADGDVFYLDEKGKVVEVFEFPPRRWKVR